MLRLLDTHTQINSPIYQILTALVTTGSLLTQCWLTNPAIAATKDYCMFNQEDISTKENLLQSSLKGDSAAQQNYANILRQHAEMLRQCRSRTWPSQQAIWLRLYPCDVRPGSIDYVLDRIVNLGYNIVYLEVFYDGQVLLPPADNPTPWVSVVRSPGGSNRDLLAETIKKGHERGLKVYAWLFTMNFGYNYAQKPEKQALLARNGKGEDSLSFVHDQSQAFIDPYHRQAQMDYYQLIQAVLKRRPDGVLFDYVRYPRGTGSESLVSTVKDLWIYGEASQQALYDRGQNNQGRALIQKYVRQGNINSNDFLSVKKLYPQEKTPLWQGRNPQASNSLGRINLDLWHLVIAHAAQGVIDFLNLAAYPVQRQGLPVGTVFFPDGNQLVGERGFDSRLQPWDNFSPSFEWHPMSYAICGKPSCIVEQVQRVLSMSSPQTEIIPAIAGLWGKSTENRPSLEQQMWAIRSAAPQIKAISHFAYSWQEPTIDRERQSCDLRNF